MNSNQRSAKIIFFFTLTESKIHFIKTYVEDIKVIKYSFKNLVFKLTSDIQQGRATNKFIKYHLNTLLYGWNMMLNGPHRMISPTSLSCYNVLDFVFWQKKPKIFTTRPFAKKKKKVNPYFTVVKMNKIELNATTWMTLTNIWIKRNQILKSLQYEFISIKFKILCLGMHK